MLPGPFPLENSSGSQILRKQKYTQRIPHPSGGWGMGSRLEVQKIPGWALACL